MSDNPFTSTLLDQNEKSSSVTEDPNSLKLNDLSDLSKNDTSASLEYCTKTIDETISSLNTNPKDGLSDLNDIKSRQDEFGENECKSDDDDEPLIIQFLKTFAEDPLILLLIASAVVSFLMGNTDDAISITMAIVIVVTVGFVQEYRSEKTLEALNELVPMECHLIRSGNSNANILASTLVPGDLVVLRTGDKVPADIRIIESVNLHINESSLTGETTPVLKNKDPVNPKNNSNIPISDRSNIAFMGTLVTDGSAKGIVIGTGKNTMFGKVFEMMNSIKKPKTPLQQAMDKLGRDLSYFSFMLIGVICLIGVIQGRSWLAMFQISVSLAVAAIPEGLPIIVTVTLALGVLRMANKKAIVKRLPSVETLGSVNVICSDKTGTLTMNMMKVTKLWTLGSMENGGNVMDVENKKQSHGIYNDFVKTLNGNDSDKKRFSDINKLLECGNICNTAIYSNEQYKYIGNPTEIAIMDLLRDFGLQDKRNDIKFEKKYELPFNSSRKYMAVSLQNDELYVKGALERILDNSKYYLSATGKKG